ncbi:MAG: ATP-binding protein [Proteobacteria bacterium]|nr:ATP-binding protein [Pseudomonadota bacterium]
MLIESLIQQEENEYLDYKEQYFENFDHILHDLLCLLNSENEGNRYIIFGVKDKTKEIVGIENDIYRYKWQDDNLQDWLQHIAFNRKPHIKFEEVEYCGNHLGLMTIKNRYDKPFYLKKSRGGARAGVVYTRNGSSNTPKDETASDVDIERMWRERFGINLGSIDRLSLLMSNKVNWVQNEKGIIHHKQHPEFYIRSSDEEQRFDEKNVYREAIKIPSASKGDYIKEFEIYYFSTHIASVRLITIDESRYIMPNFDLSFPDKDSFQMFVLKKSLDYRFFRIYQHLNNHVRSFEIFYNSFTEEENQYLFYPL